jgi:hypothetical protein
MRTLLALILGWLMPAKGTHRAAPEPAAAPAPVRRSTRPVPVPLDGEAVALIRPYLTAWETERERGRQRERRRAAVLATLGQDYPAEVSA